MMGFFVIFEMFGFVPQPKLPC